MNSIEFGQPNETPIKVTYSNTSGSALGVVPKYHNKLTNEYYKTGLFDSQSGTFGIEPINETIAYYVGRGLGIDITPQELVIKNIIFQGKKYRTLLNVSKDYKLSVGSHIYEELSIFDLSTEENPIYNAEDLLKFLNNNSSTEYLIKLAMFDFIILNQDRHKGNIKWLYDVHTDEVFESPVFDNGFSLNYSNPESMYNLNDAIKESKNPMIGDLFESEYFLKKFIRDYGNLNLINLNIDFDIILNNVYDKYDHLIKNEKHLNSLCPDNKWFQCIAQFLKYRKNLLIELLESNKEW